MVGRRAGGGTSDAEVAAIEAALAAREAQRPSVWTGHLVLHGADAERSARFYEAIGMRRIAVMSPFAIMELRGGTHLVVRITDGPQPAPAPFDLMVDDLDAARDRFAAAGIPMGEVARDERGNHRQFVVTDPDGNTIVVNDSHVVGPA